IEAFVAGEVLTLGVEPVCGVLQAGDNPGVGVLLVVHEGVLYRETSPVKAWFLVSEAIDRSWCLRLRLSPLRRGLLHSRPYQVVGGRDVVRQQVSSDTECGVPPLFESLVVDLVGP